MFNKKLYDNSKIYKKCVLKLSENIKQKAGRDFVNIIFESLPQLIIQVLYRQQAGKIDLKLHNAGEGGGFSIDVYAVSIFISLLSILMNLKVAVTEGGIN